MSLQAVLTLISLESWHKHRAVRTHKAHLHTSSLFYLDSMLCITLGRRGGGLVVSVDLSLAV